MCSETVSPRFSFSHDLPETESEILKVSHDVPRRDTMLLVESNPEFEFSTSRSLEFESSSASADELFSNGVILPMQIQNKRNLRLPPRPCSTTSVDNKIKKDSIIIRREKVEDYEKNSKSTSFWGGFSRSKSLNCDTKKSFVCSSPPLSRSNSAGSAQNLKRVSSNRHQSGVTTTKPLSSSCLYPPLQKSSSGKGGYANGHRISPVLNMPTPNYFSKGSAASLFGFGSFLRVGKGKKNNI